MATPAKHKWKSMIWAGAFAAAIMSGSLYGAGLKIQRDHTREKQKVLEATAEEKIAMLEARRMALVRQKTELESKIAGFQERVRARKE